MPFALGPIVFAAPLALIALIGLPLLWLILRATPPQPKLQELPSLALFDDLAPKEETPDHTPWWIILLRMLIATLAIIGLASPVWSPMVREDTTARSDDVILLMDSGWTAAPDWSERQRTALGVLSTMDRDRGVYLLKSTEAEYTDSLASRLTVQEARSQVRALRPDAWLTNYTTLKDSLSELSDRQFETIWISDKLKAEGQDELIDQLKRLGSVDVIEFGTEPIIAIAGLSTSAKGPKLTLARRSSDAPVTVTLAAFDASGRSLATEEAAFTSGSLTAEAEFDLPETIQTDISWFKVMGRTSAGGVWQWEGANRIRRVGLLSEGQSLQPLLSDTYYVRKALAPFATITEGTLGELLTEDLNAIILTDVGKLSDVDEPRLRKWVEDGGVLIRFAGPRLASQSDTLLPVRLRRASRALDSALSWDTPQSLTSFSETSPFAPLIIRDEVLIRRQVLAQPDPELAQRTWARLADGTPLVTSARQGQGRLILFHVTAGPEWSDLPLSGIFVDMLRRSTLPARELADVSIQPDTSLAPKRWLNGFGDFISPAPSAQPIQVNGAEAILPTAEHPAGLYEGGAVTLPLNAAAGWEADPITSWPSGVTTRSVEARTATRLGGLFLCAAMILLLIDLVVSLLLAGRLRFTKSGFAAVILLAGSVCFLPLQDAHAQVRRDPDSKSPAAALDLRFGFIRTGDAATDKKAEEGLTGLSSMLFRRTTVEPEAPMGLDLATDSLSLYPLILIQMPQAGLTLDENQRKALSRYLRNGGALLIDTQAGGNVSSGSESDPRLANLLEGLDIPPLLPAGDEHVLTRSFYLLDGFSGRFPNRPVWIESSSGKAGDQQRGDGISSIFITDADMAGAWAIDKRGRPLYSVEGGERNREMAYRTGINLVMYVLTGNYKEDQVHLPSLLERLGEVTSPSDPDADGMPTILTPGDEN